MPFFYAVARGRNVGIYNSWNECNEQVSGFKNARYKKFPSVDEAQAFIIEHQATGYTPVRQVDNNSYARNDRVSYSTKAEHSPSSSSGAMRNGVKSTRFAPYSTSSRVLSSSSRVPATSDIPIIYTDGACSHNGRSSAKAGYGVYWGPDSVDNCWGPVQGEATNNRGELTAVREAMNQAVAKRIPEIRIRTDSQLTINSMDSWIHKWKRNGWKTAAGQPVKNVDLLTQIDNLRAQVKVHFEHVRGHAGEPGNEAADELARRGAEEY